MLQAAGFQDTPIPLQIIFASTGLIERDALKSRKSYSWISRFVVSQQDQEPSTKTAYCPYATDEKAVAHIAKLSAVIFSTLVVEARASTTSPYSSCSDSAGIRSTGHNDTEEDRYSEKES